MFHVLMSLLRAAKSMALTVVFPLLAMAGFLAGLVPSTTRFGLLFGDFVFVCVFSFLLIIFLIFFVNELRKTLKQAWRLSHDDATEDTL